MLQILQIFIFDFFSESLFFRSDLFCLSSVFFFDGFNHIIQFFKVVVVSLFHLTSFSQKFILEYPNISPELFHKSLHAWSLNREKRIDMDEMVTNGNLVLIIGLI